MRLAQDDTIMEVLPGTVRLYDVREGLLVGETAITLVPQPTASPDDPLRWSLPRKYWHAFLICFITALTAATSNDAGSAASAVTTDLGVSWTSINNAAGVLFAGIGYATLLFSPTVSLYGRRLNYLICLLLSVGGSVWFASVTGTSGSIWNQLFVGASESCAEAAAQTSLSDLFYQHQRGTVLGFYVLATNVGTYMGPLISGYIAASSLTWRWIGWWSAIISGVTFFVFYVGLEETAFDRRGIVHGVSPEMAEGEPSLLEGEKIANAQDSRLLDVVHAGEVDDVSASRKPYRERIALITPASNLRGFGFKQYAQQLWHTLKVFTLLPVWFAGLQWGLQDAWLTFYLTLEEDNWYGPPWNYTNTATALMNVPCVIGSLIGCIYGGYLSDVFVGWMARRNNGVAEAEHRLWLMFPAAIVAPVGFILFGIGTNNGWSWPLPYVALGFIGFGWGSLGDISMSYLMDCYPEMVMEGMVGVSVINNTIALAFTFGTGPWLGAQSVSGVMIIMGVLGFAFIMTAAPMMMFGKRIRRSTLGRYKRFLELRDRT